MKGWRRESRGQRGGEVRIHMRRRRKRAAEEKGGEAAMQERFVSTALWGSQRLRGGFRKLQQDQTG